MFKALIHGKPRLSIERVLNCTIPEIDLYLDQDLEKPTPAPGERIMTGAEAERFRWWLVETRNKPEARLAEAKQRWGRQ